MEGKEDIQSSGGVMRGDEVPDTYRVAARSDNPTRFNESTTPAVPLFEHPVVPPVAPPVSAVTEPLAAVVQPSPQPTMVAQPPTTMVAQPPTTMVALPAIPVGGATPGTDSLKKRRGRPRKYGPDGKPAVALSPMPISASIPLTGEYSTWKPTSRGRSVDSYKKKHKLEYERPGERVAYSVGANFTPHVITVNAGEDVTMKIISFSQQGSRAICILAANGAISNVTLRQPNSSGGTLTYEGRFEILSLSGSFMPTDSGGTKSRTGGMSVSLAGPDGRVLGGGIAGLLVAAGPVQVVIGSFLPGHQQEQQKPKKQKFEVATAFSPVPPNHISQEGTDGVYGGTKPSVTPVSYHGDNVGSANAFHGSKIFGSENNVSSLPGESKDLSPSKCMVSC